MWPSIGRLSLECLYRTLLVIYLTLITENVSCVGGIWLILLGKNTLQVNWQLSIWQGAKALKDCFCKFPRHMIIRQYMSKLTHLHWPPMCCILSERWNVEQKTVRSESYYTNTVGKNLIRSCRWPVAMVIGQLFHISVISSFSSNSVIAFG